MDRSQKINKNMKISIAILLIIAMLSEPTTMMGQLNKPTIISLPDKAQITLPMRWYVADESLVREMKQQTTGSLSGLLHLLFPSNDMSEQKGYPFISIGYSYIDADAMKSFSFSRFVAEQKKLLSGALKTQLEEIAPHQFDELKTSELYVDDSKQIIIFSHESGVPNYGQVVGYTAIVKSKTGLIRINLASLKNDIDKYLPAFRIIIKSFTYK
jgi:hypothetical protein